MVSMFPSPSQDYQQTQIDLNAALVRDPANTFFIRVRGQGMEGAEIFDGDEIIVDRALKPTPGRVVVATLDGEMTVKRFIVDRNNRGWLITDGNQQPPIAIAPESEFSIYGVVTRCLRRLETPTLP